MPSSFLFPRSDLLIDLIVVATVAAVPLLAYSIHLARQRKILLHRRLQLTLTVVFILATIALEIDIRMAGGMRHFSQGGRFEGTALLQWTLYVHLTIAAANAFFWVILPIWSHRAHIRGELPGPRSRKHRALGRVAAVLCILTAGTGVQLYILGFVL